MKKKNLRSSGNEGLKNLINNYLKFSQNINLAVQNTMGSSCSRRNNSIIVRDNNFFINQDIFNNNIKYHNNDNNDLSNISFLKTPYPYYDYKSINIKKDVSNINNKRTKKGSSNKVLPRVLDSLEEKYDFHRNNNNNTLAKSVSKHPKYKLKIKIDDVIKAVKHNELNKDTYHGLSLKRDGEDEIITDYYLQQNFLRNSSPYINEHEKQILEEKENKKHFFKNKNFVTSVGKYSMKPNFIPNYVGLTPGENPKNHEFREVDKNKWMNKKGFNI